MNSAVRQAKRVWMRPVGYPVVASHRFRWWIAFWSMLPVAVLVAWVFSGEGWSYRTILAGLLWLGCWCWAIVSIDCLVPALLYWDGSAWWLRGRGQPPVMLAVVDLRIAMDGQRWLLLRVRLDNRRVARWLVLRAVASPGAWLEMRRCLYSTTL